MKIGWIRDFTLTERPGGAQVCEDLLRRAIPKGVELIECPPGSVQSDVDGYVVLRCQRYSVEEITQIVAKPCFHWAMDYWEWGNFEQRKLVFTEIKNIVFGSPLHKSVFVSRWGLGEQAGLLAYPIDVERWLSLREKSNGRQGAMWYGEIHPYKGLDLTITWAMKNKITLDIYGIGLKGAEHENPYINLRGQCTGEEQGLALASHELFPHFPRAPEGFCYSLMEAWLSGLKVVYAGRIGLDSWEKPWDELAKDCYEAPTRFWKLVEQCL